jgi:hypothetical protein
LDDHYLCQREVAERDQRIRELEAALHEIADFSEQFIGDDEDGDERMYKVNQIADTTLALDRRDERLRAENEALKKEIEEMSYLTTRDDYEEMERKYSYAKQEAETNHYLAKKWEADLAAVRVELAECRISRQREHDLRVTIAGELESFKIRYQDEVNTRVNAENELDTVHSGFVAELRKAETAKLFVRQNFIADDEDGDKHE